MRRIVSVSGVYRLEELFEGIPVSWNTVGMKFKVGCIAFIAALLPLSVSAAELDRYKFYTGDLNSDGIPDLYLERKVSHKY